MGAAIMGTAVGGTVIEGIVLGGIVLGGIVLAGAIGMVTGPAAGPMSSAALASSGVTGRRPL